MARFTKAELQGFRGAELPDLVGPGLRLLFVGINPGLWTAAVQTHFAHPANRFYPALALAGILERPVSPSDGMTDADREAFVARGLGITNLASRATARADELSAAELRAGGERLVALVEEHRPGWWRCSGSPPTGARSAPAAPYRGGSRARSAAPSCGWCRTRPV